MSSTTTAATRSIGDMRALSKTTAKAAGGTNVAAYFEANKSAIAAVLPRHMTSDRMAKIGMRCIRTNPKLANCELGSFLGAVITCAQLGLEPNTPQGHIFLIPFENKRKGITEVQVITGYKGLIDLARRSGEIVSISSRVIYTRDELDIEFGTDERCTVKPCLDDDPGAIRGFLGVAKLKDGGTQFEYMTVRQVNEIRDSSQGYSSAKRFGKLDGSPWHTNYPEMGRKTVIRRLCKYLPMSIELANLLEREDAGDRGLSQGLDNVLNLDPNEYAVITPDEEEATTAAEDDASEAARPAETTKAPETLAKPAVDESARPKLADGAKQADQAKPAETAKTADKSDMFGEVE